MGNYLFLSGSIRTGSYNTMLAKQAYELAKLGGLNGETEWLSLEDYAMPIYNGDLEEKEGLPEAAKRLKEKFIACNGFFIASPEYNSSISPLLKNSLDWISRKSSNDEPSLIAFTGKTAALAAASPGGFGGLRGLVPLRMMLGNIGVTVSPTQLAIPHCADTFDSKGNLTDKALLEKLRTVITDWSQLQRVKHD